MTILILAGCASRYYAGIESDSGEGSRYFRSVTNRKADQEIINYEGAFIQNLSSGGIKNVTQFLSDSVSVRIGNGAADSISRFFLTVGANGLYHKVGLVGGGLDEALFHAPFDYYDALEGRYLLGSSLPERGPHPAFLKVWYEKIDNELKVCGFVIMECLADPTGNCMHPDTSFFYAVKYFRSVNKSGNSERPYTVIPSK